MIVLGIETSCDETAAALVERRADGSGRILADIVLSQIADHAAYGGVVPEIAARAHVEALDGVVQAAMREAGFAFCDLDAVAATAGPGLIGGVLVGLTSAKAMALAAGKPLIAVNHLEGHALTARLTDGLDFPYLLLLVSGGHSQFVAVDGVGAYRRLGTTIDDALGEAFDKAAKLLGLPYPGGPAVEAEAQNGDPARFNLPRPLLGRSGADFSFSGLKTALRLAAEAIAPLSGRDVADLCAAFQAAVTDVVADRAAHAMAMFRDQHPQAGAVVRPSRPAASRRAPQDEEGGSHGKVRLKQPTMTALTDSIAPHPDVLREAEPRRTQDGSSSLAAGNREPIAPALVVSGGVAANQAIRTALRGEAAKHGVRLIAPPPRLCADNGVMIAWAGAERLALGLTDGLDFAARPRWPLDETVAPVLGAGIKGAKA